VVTGDFLKEAGRKHMGDRLRIGAEWCDMTDLKQRLAAVLASPEGQAMIEEGQQFSIEELQAAFAQVLAEAKDHERVVLEAAMNAVIARKAN
jgi:hypothetical protein